MKIFKISGILNNNKVTKSVEAEDKPKAIVKFINECLHMKEQPSKDGFVLTKIVEEKASEI